MGTYVATCAFAKMLCGLEMYYPLDICHIRISGLRDNCFPLLEIVT